MPPSSLSSSPLAHIAVDDSGISREEPLREHLEETVKLAREFAQKFGLGETAKLVAKFHDLGKFSREFQDYLKQSAGDSEECDASPRQRSRGPDHSTAGARFLAKTLIQNNLGTLLAYAIAGHHAGLPNGIDGGNGSLETRIEYKKIKDWERAARANLPSDFFEISSVNSVVREILALVRNSANGAFSLAFALRMIFSCLVDADFLATEKFMNPEKSELRKHGSPETIPLLEQRLAEYLLRFDNATSPIGVIRNEVRADCLAVAELPTGTFRLTVPTGGGKTPLSNITAMSKSTTTRERHSPNSQQKIGMRRLSLQQTCSFSNRFSLIKHRVPASYTTSQNPSLF